MRKHYTSAFKAQVVREMLREEKSITQIASEHGVDPNVLHKWKAQLREAHERQLHELYAEIGRLALPVAWLKRKAGIEHIQG